MDTSKPMEWEDEYRDHMELQAALPAQALLACSCIQRYLSHLRMSSAHHPLSHLCGSSLIGELVDLVHRMRASRDSEVPLGVMREVRRCNPMFDGYSQHDAHELLLTLLEDFDDHSVALIHPFQGSVRSTLSCGNCGVGTHRDEMSQGISVELPPEKLQGHSWWNPAGWFSPPPSVSLGACLRAFFETETLDDDNLWKCDHCMSVASGTTKKLSICQLPEILPIHIKRFKHQPEPAKLDFFVKYPLHGLDLSPFCTGSTVYDLNAVVCHYGSLYHGHYVAYCKVNKEESWLLCDDSRVSRVHLQDVTVLHQAAYILFYVRRPTAEQQSATNRILDLYRISSLSGVGGCKLVSHCWWNRLKTYSHPGPIVDDSLCEHGMLLPARGAAQLSEDSHAPQHSPLYVEIPVDVAEACSGEFGGAEFLHDALPQTCTLCSKNKRASASHRLAEKQEALALDRSYLKPGERFVLIDADWVVRWFRYVENTEADPPGPVDNTRLLDRNGVLREDLQPIRDFRKLAPPVYEYFISRHGCIGAKQHLRDTVPKL